MKKLVLISMLLCSGLQAITYQEALLATVGATALKVAGLCIYNSATTKNEMYQAAALCGGGMVLQCVTDAHSSGFVVDPYMRNCVATAASLYLNKGRANSFGSLIANTFIPGWIESTFFENTCHPVVTHSGYHIHLHWW